MQHAYNSAHLPKIEGAKVAILQAKWHSEQTDRMIAKCHAILVSVGATCDLHILPGSLELPLAADRLAKRKVYDAIICFGVIMKGETHHFDLILNMIEQGFVRAMHDNDMPILIEILPVTTMAQVEARSADNEFNKGIEAALATADIIKWRRENV